ncbi:MAG: hypothetical protein CL910_22260 [Deltaproteobacteria bacterium]|jgi:hypothetical protein|nr:hypothetical protein [Deltaproteobacteria bacterium]
MNDVIRAFRGRTMDRDLQAVRDRSDSVRLAPDPRSGEPPARLHGVFRDLAYFEPDVQRSCRVVRRPLPFSLTFADDYCCCSDGSLQMRVAQLHAPIVHPNVAPGGLVCLGPRFRPGTKLPALLEHLHAIVSGRVYASESPLDPEAARLFLREGERVRALRSAPLWRDPVARAVRVETR